MTAIRLAVIGILVIALLGATVTPVCSDLLDLPGTANPKAPPLRVWRVRDLGFGDIFPGVPTWIPISNPSSAMWLVTGTRGVEIQLNFVSLPPALKHGGDWLPVSYGATDAGWNTDNNPSTATIFDPNVGTVARLHPFWGFTLVWLGGTANPTPVQPPARYRAKASLEALYVN